MRYFWQTVCVIEIKLRIKYFKIISNFRSVFICLAVAVNIHADVVIGPPGMPGFPGPKGIWGDIYVRFPE